MVVNMVLLGITHSYLYSGAPTTHAYIFACQVYVTGAKIQAQSISSLIVCSKLLCY